MSKKIATTPELIMKIAMIQNEDSQAVLALMTSIIATLHFSQEMQQELNENVAENLHWWNANPTQGCHLKCTLNEQIVGVILIKKFWNLCSLFVATEHQGQGLGRALMLAAIEQCKGKSEKQAIWLNAAPNAIPFYQALGCISRSSQQQLPQGFMPMQIVF
jgi:GNAT superfamily N-acetyltransferase